MRASPILVTYWVAQNTATLDYGHSMLCPYSLNTGLVARAAGSRQGERRRGGFLEVSGLR